VPHPDRGHLVPTWMAGTSPAMTADGNAANN